MSSQKKCKPFLETQPIKSSKGPANWMNGDIQGFILDERGYKRWVEDVMVRKRME